jgi:hypothetical protein
MRFRPGARPDSIVLNYGKSQIDLDLPTLEQLERQD